MRGKRALTKATKSFSKEKVNTKTIYYGELGITLAGSQVVDVPNRDGFVFVRIKGNTSELIQALNSSVPSSYGLAVLLHRDGQNYKIIGKDDKAYANQGIQIPGGVYPLPRHGGQHSFAPELNIGADPVWVFSKQFMPLLPYPSGTSMLLTLNSSFYEWEGSWRYAQTTGSANFTPYIPTITGSARMALLYITPSNNALNIAGGTPFSADITDKNTLAQYIPDVDRNTSIPIAAVRLVTGTTAISWTDIYDMRDFYIVGKRWEGIGIQDDGVPIGTGTILNFNNNLSSSVSNGVVTINATAGGGGGGGIGVVAWDEGIFLGTGTILNFVGPNVDASISGSVIRVFVTGSTGGSVSPPVTGSVVVQDEGATLGSVTILNFVGNGIDVSVSGSVARVHVTGSVSTQGWISSEKMIVDNLTLQATGSNTNFNLMYSMVSGTSNLFYNGVRQKVDDHYFVTGTYNQIKTLFIPTSPDTLIAVYEIQVSGTLSDGGGGSSSSGGSLTYNAITITTSNVSAVEGNMYDCTIAGLTADRDFNLPTPSAAGKEIELRVLDGDDAFELIIKANSSEITRVFIENETLRFMSHGTGAGDWKIVEDGRIRCKGQMTLSAADTTNTAATDTLPTWDTKVIDVGNIGDTTNFRFNIRRAGYYRIAGSYLENSAITDQNYLAIVIKQNSTNVVQALTRASNSSANFALPLPIKTVLCAAGDTLSFYYNTEQSDRGMLNDAPRSYFQVEEEF